VEGEGRRLSGDLLKSEPESIESEGEGADILNCFVPDTVEKEQTDA
jgi:hypothetical protein